MRRGEGWAMDCKSWTMVRIRYQWCCRRRYLFSSWKHHHHDHHCRWDNYVRGEAPGAVGVGCFFSPFCSADLVVLAEMAPSAGHNAYRKNNVVAILSAVRWIVCTYIVLLCFFMSRKKIRKGQIIPTPFEKSNISFKISHFVKKSDYYFMSVKKKQK